MTAFVPIWILGASFVGLVALNVLFSRGHSSMDDLSQPRRPLER